MKERILDYQLPVRGKAQARILVATDIHFEAGREAKLLPILAAAEKLKPSAVVLAGDTINYLNDIAKPKDRTALRTFLEKLTKIAPTFVGVGNHDLMYKNRVYSPEKAPGELAEFIDFIESVPDITLLHNRRAKLASDINLIGVTLERDCYQRAGSAATYESEHRLRETLAEQAALLARQKPGETNLLFLHSPRRLTPEILQGLAGVDYVICGHMHQGCVPLGLDEKLPGSVGIIAPGYAPLPRRARGSHKRTGAPKSSPGAELVILPAYKTFAQWRRPANLLFPQSLSLLELGKHTAPVK